MMDIQLIVRGLIFLAIGAAVYGTIAALVIYWEELSEHVRAIIVLAFIVLLGYAFISNYRPATRESYDGEDDSPHGLPFD